MEDTPNYNMLCIKMKHNKAKYSVDTHPVKKKKNHTIIQNPTTSFLKSCIPADLPFMA